jgi:hypothetical protein
VDDREIHDFTDVRRPFVIIPKMKTYACSCSVRMKGRWRFTSVSAPLPRSGRSWYFDELQVLAKAAGWCSD